MWLGKLIKPCWRFLLMSSEMLSTGGLDKKNNLLLQLSSIFNVDNMLLWMWQVWRHAVCVVSRFRYKKFLFVEKYWPEHKKKEKKKCPQYAQSPKIAVHCFLFVRVSEEGFLCLFSKWSCCVSGTKANPYVTLAEQLLVRAPPRHQKQHTSYQPPPLLSSVTVSVAVVAEESHLKWIPRLCLDKEDTSRLFAQICLFIFFIHFLMLIIRLAEHLTMWFSLSGWVVCACVRPSEPSLNNDPQL